MELVVQALENETLDDGTELGDALVALVKGDCLLVPTEKSLFVTVRLG